MTVVTKLTLIQLLMTLFFSGFAAYFYSSLHGISALIGGLICTIANMFFAGKLFLGKNMTDPDKILKQFYRSETLKILFTVAMFVIVIKLTAIDFLSFILAYSFAAFLNLVCLPFLNDNGEQKTQPNQN